MKKQEKKRAEFGSLLEIQKRFPTEQSCRDYFEKARWNGKPICPHCGSDRISRYTNGKLLFCGACRKQFTVKVGTIFEDSHISLQKWFFAIYLLTAHKKGISSCQLARDIGITQKSAWFMLQRIRYAMKTKSALKRMANIVEADETYIGGYHRGKTGRGSENKTAVFGMAEREGDVRACPVKRVDGKTLKGIIRQNVSRDATIFTDEWTAYNKLSDEFKHQVVNHGRKEYVRGNVHLSSMENFWSMLKRGILGIYHHVSPKHLHRYCDEFQYRHNSRKVTDSERFTTTLTTCQGRLTHKSLIGELA